MLAVEPLGEMTIEARVCRDGQRRIATMGNETYIETSRSRCPALDDESDGQPFERGSLPNLILPSFRQQDRLVVAVTPVRSTRLG